MKNETDRIPTPPLGFALNWNLFDKLALRSVAIRALLCVSKSIDYMQIRLSLLRMSPRPKRRQLRYSSNWRVCISILCCLFGMSFLQPTTTANASVDLTPQQFSEYGNVQVLGDAVFVFSDHQGRGHSHDDDFLNSQLEFGSPHGHGHDHNPFDHSHETQHLPPSFVLTGLKPTRHWLALAEPLVPPTTLDSLYRPPTGLLAS